MLKINLILDYEEFSGINMMPIEQFMNEFNKSSLHNHIDCIVLEYFNFSEDK